jgi:hypothetical protein
MPRVWCPHCRKGAVKVSDPVVQMVFVCPNCCTTVTVARRPGDGTGGQIPRKALESPPEPVIETPLTVADETPPPPVPLETFLTSPHICSQCKRPIHDGIGASRATVVCASCGNRTSLYAIIYRCTCGNLLESPASREGEKEECPRCGQCLEVPHDVLFEESDGSGSEDWLRFACSHCSRSLVVRQEDAGQRAACPSCYGLLDVPRLAEALSAAPAERNPLRSVHESSEMRCPKCATRIPTRAQACPVCGQAT